MQSRCDPWSPQGAGCAWRTWLSRGLMIEHEPPKSTMSWSTLIASTYFFSSMTFRVKLKASVTQSCQTLCDPTDCSPPGSSVHEDSPGKSTGVGSHFLLQGIFPTQWSNSHLLHWQAESLPLTHLRKEERKWSRSVMSDSATLRTADRQVPLSMGFSRQEYWSGLPFPSLGNLPDPGIKPRSPTLQPDSTIWATRACPATWKTMYVSVYTCLYCASPGNISEVYRKNGFPLILLTPT